MKRVFLALLIVAFPVLAFGQTTWTVTPDSGMKIESPSIDSTGKLNFTVSPTTTIPPPPPPPPPTATTPAAEWTLKQTSISGTTAADASGNGNSAAVVGGPLTFGSVGANFNGNQYLDSALTVASPALTVSVWFNSANLGANPWGNPRLVANSHTDTDKKGFQLMFSNGGGSGFFDVGNGTAEGRASWSKQLTTGTLYHYVGVYDGSTVKAYINGSQVASVPFSGGSIAAGNGPRLSVARNPTYNGDFFVGAISDVRIYREALSGSDISALYQAGAK
jgi:hypothetical protein